MGSNVKFSRFILGIIVAFSCLANGMAQDQDDEYLKVVTKRAEKIVLSLDLKNPEGIAVIKKPAAKAVRTISARRGFHLP